MNDFEDALICLESSSSIKRFQAARFLSQNFNPMALGALRARQKIEKVRHVKTAIDRAIDRLDTANKEVLNEIESYDDSNNLKKHLKAKAIDEFSGLILHELEPKLGLLRLSAKQETPDYERSALKKHVDNIFQLLLAIENLRKSASAPKLQQVDLSQIIKDVCAQEAGERVNTLFEGGQPFLAMCDPNLLTLALSNAVRNASESIGLYPGTESRKLIISWGLTEIDGWISIIDEGVGLSGTAEGAFALGTTNKPNHTGFGLAIIRQAMENMDGLVELMPATTGGVQLLLRWNIK